MAETNKEKKIWTEEERLELAAKLDAELDEFINGLEKKRYEEGWPEDRWQEEMDKHPFFMKKEPQPGDEVHPMFEGLQKLKYDPEENTREELALNYKEDGNFYMKHKKYRTAILSYTEGIKAKCENSEVLAALYNNRSVAHFKLENYRSSSIDAEKALEYKPDYEKAAVRICKCAFKLKKYDLCAERCDNFIEEFPDNEELRDLLSRSKQELAELAWAQRKVAIAVKKRLSEFEILCAALEDRGVQFDDLPPGQPLTEEFLRPKFLPLEDDPVHLHENNISLLIWPIVFCYPEYRFSDFQVEVPENSTMNDCLNTIMVEEFPFDKDHVYTAETVSVYYENRKAGTLHRVYTNKTIKSIVEEERFYVSRGALIFYVVPTNSRIEEEFVNHIHPRTVFNYVLPS